MEEDNRDNSGVFIVVFLTILLLIAGLTIEDSNQYLLAYLISGE